MIKAKYLPINEDFEKGDNVMFFISRSMIHGTYLGGNDFINNIGEKVSLEKWQSRFNITKAKLFAVSDEINSDDLVYWDGSKQINRFCDSYREPGPYDLKVIGEISSKAKWVKDGMTINDFVLIPQPKVGDKMYNTEDKSVKITWKKHSYVDLILEDWDFVDKIKSNYLVKILCPCCEEFK